MSATTECRERPDVTRENPIPAGIKGRRPGKKEFATAPCRVLPDFIVIGAQKSGTWSLYYNLSQHPNIVPALRKEVHFFDWKFHRGTLFYRAHFPVVFEKWRARVRRRAFFTGEASPYYIFHPLAPGRLKAVVPGARLIALLRNPVDRAYSHYQHAVAKGQESLSFEKALREEKRRTGGEVGRMMADPRYNSTSHRNYSYIERGLYAQQLERWFELFPRKQFLILHSERFRNDPPSAFREVCRFLGVPEWEPPQYREIVKRRYEPMRPETRTWLLDYFRPYNRQLYELLDRDFQWDR